MSFSRLVTPLPSLDVPGTAPSHGAAKVRIWRAHLEQPALIIEEQHRLLSPDEQSRAARFHFERDRNRYIIARSALRTILGHCLGVEPERLGFCYSPYGKPDLTPEFSGSGTRFNVSHSHEEALFAVTQGLELGIDIEWRRVDFATMEIAERFFSRREVAVLQALPPESQVKAFFDCWTRKEAYLKATGVGLSLPLDKFDVSLAPGEPAALLHTEDDPTEASRWALHDLLVEEGYSAALAIEVESNGR